MPNVKLLHTADLHLNADRPETVEALEVVLAEASKHEVDIVTIAGDLFDSQAAADALRPQLRPLFSDNPFEIVAIPGNHDEEVYRENLQFGEDLTILVDQPLSTYQVNDLEIVGVPFTATMDDALFGTLLETGSPETHQCLLLHCTLDLGFYAHEAGEEDASYFPVSQATLEAFDFEYILAGHIHSREREVPLGNGARFIYPGSPVSHSWKERGKRTAILVDTAVHSVRSVELETFYYDAYERTIRPGEERVVLEEINEWVQARTGHPCELRVEVDGYIDIDEQTFDDRLHAVTPEIATQNQTRTVSEVLAHPLYERFTESLAERDDIEDTAYIESFVLGVFADLLSQRKVQPP